MKRDNSAIRNGKHYRLINYFIEKVIEGKNALCVSPKFVVMNTEYYYELAKKKDPEMVIKVRDELSEMTEFDWKMLSARLNTKGEKL